MGWVEDKVEDLGDAVEDAVEWIGDEIVDPVVDFAGDMIDAALDNPIKTIAQIAAIATQQYWLLPYIEGADVAAKGGDIEDVAKAVVVAVVAQEVGARVGQAVAANTTNAATAASYGTTAASQQTAMLAAQEAGMQTASQIAGNIAGSAAGSAASAIVTGQDPVKAMITGGVNAAVPAVLGQVDGFRGARTAIYTFQNRVLDQEFDDQSRFQKLAPPQRAVHEQDSLFQSLLMDPLGHLKGRLHLD
jgi:hypothetical protein